MASCTVPVFHGTRCASIPRAEPTNREPSSGYNPMHPAQLVAMSMTSFPFAYHSAASRFLTPEVLLYRRLPTMRALSPVEIASAFRPPHLPHPVATASRTSKPPSSFSIADILRPASPSDSETLRDDVIGRRPRHDSLTSSKLHSPTSARNTVGSVVWNHVEEFDVDDCSDGDDDDEVEDELIEVDDCDVTGAGVRCHGDAVGGGASPLTALMRMTRRPLDRESKECVDEETPITRSKPLLYSLRYITATLSYAQEMPT